MTGLALYYDTEESAEGTTAFQEKRAPDFGRFRK
jgi:2-ketocyclohexanecarboxyl-CoA hydrolase